MIISRTPLRMSFAGGGSDIASYYRQFGGAVVSTAINQYIYVNVNKKFDDGIRIGYSKNEEVRGVGQIEHPIVRAVLPYLGIRGGIEITTIADIPSRGTGLGSSSAFTVGLLHALRAYQGLSSSSSELADAACTIEIDHCQEPIGKQDQYACAFGGLNLIEFARDDVVTVKPIMCSAQTVETLQKHILVFYTGKTRSAAQVLSAQTADLASDPKKQQTMHAMVKLAYELAAQLEQNNCAAVGEILHAGWILKKSLVKEISSTQIDAWYASARSAGALGGRILGAGAGGFLMLYAPPDCHEKITHSLSELRRVPIQFETLGSQIIFPSPLLAF